MPTKEQVLKRMAEIEGWYVEEPVPGYIRLWISEEFCESGDTYGIVDPLDNPSDWAVLIEKYRLQIEPPSKFEKDCFSIRELWNVCPYDSNDGAKSESLPWAICLAIIESKGGMGDE